MRSISIGLVVHEATEERLHLQQTFAAEGYRCRMVVAPDPLDARDLKAALELLDTGCIVAVRRGVSPRVRDLEYAVAMVAAESTDLFIGTFDQIINEEGSVTSWSRRRGLRARLLRRITRGALSRPPCGVLIGELTALRTLLPELRLERDEVPYELAWLARRHGTRVDELPLAVRFSGELHRPPTLWWLTATGVRLRRSEARGLYRAARRCPICFSIDVYTRDQVDGHVIRACRRCKCRYLASVPAVEMIERTRLLRLDRAREREEVASRAERAMHRTMKRRVKRLRKLLPHGARVLEVGARSGELGLLLRDHFSYTGIELDAASARAARGAGLEVFRASLTDFVSLAGPYDAVLMFDVIEHLPNPHDAVAKIRELVRPGGHLVLSTPDTESVTALALGRRWSAHKVPEHIVLYSRSALVEMLENAGFEIVTAHSDYRDFDHQRLRQALSRWPRAIRRVLSAGLHLLPDPFPASSGSIRIVARRLSGPPYIVHPVPSVEMSRAR